MVNNRLKLSLLCVFLWWGWVLQASALTDVYTFSEPAQQAQFVHLLKTLRCVVCQNQSLYESDASIAQDLRQEIAEQVRQKKSEKNIVDYLTDRYGVFILYQPPWNPSTYILWAGPFVLLVSIFGVLIWQRTRRVPKRRRGVKS